jgi:dTDP-4-amino-4,6-dideoxygalactose transaminase
MLRHLSFEWPVATPAIRDAILRAIDDGEWGKYHGQFTDELLASFCDWLSAENTILCCSGTIAVELALRGVGVTTGDEVVLAAYDFPGNFRAIEAIGATPVLVDVEKNGWTIDPTELDRSISDATRAIIVSHLHGQIAAIESIKTAIETYDGKAQPIAVVEDVCQAPGGKVNGQLLGSFGDVAAFSFGGSKLLSAGRGGAITTSDPAIAQRIKVFSERGNDSFPLSQLQAAALIPQLAQLEALNLQRLTAAKRLCEKINEAAAGISTLSESQFGTTNSNAIYKIPIRVDDPAIDREAFIAKLVGNGLPVGGGFRGFFRRSKRRCRKVGELTNAKNAAEKTMLLHHPALLHDTSTIDSIANCIVNTARL